MIYKKKKKKYVIQYVESHGICGGSNSWYTVPSPQTNHSKIRVFPFYLKH